MKYRYATALLLAIGTATAHPAPFKVDSPIVESGATEVEYRGFRDFECSAHHGDSGKLVIAPLLEKELGSNWIATLNLRFEHEVGSNAAPGNVFSYAARFKYSLNPLFDPAVEFFGAPGRINHTPTFSSQTHWIGPAFYGKKKLGDGHALVYSGALLFATTSAASDNRAVMRLEYEF